MDLHESLLPFGNVPLPNELLPSKDEVIMMDGEQVNLVTLSYTERKQYINKWQQQNHLDKKDKKGPAGFFFGLQEPNVKDGKMGDLDKTGHSLHYDR